MPPQAAVAWPSPRSLDAGCAGFYAGARHGVARGGTCAASGGSGLAVAAPARRGLRWLLRWRASRCGARWHVCRLRRRRLGRCCARSARAAPAPGPARVAQGGKCVASGGGGLAVAALARRGLRWLLRWRASRCGAMRHTYAASGGGGLAVAARARRGLRRLLPLRASRSGARWHVCCLRRRWLGRRRARSARVAPASTLARVTAWREVARMPPPAAAAWLSLRALDAGCASFYAGARHGVARGGTCAATGGGSLAVAAPARRGLRQLIRWRASQCGARRHMCCLRRSRLGRCCARSARAAPASTLARVTVWREAARVPPQAAAAWPSLRPLGAGCAGFYAGARHGVARGCTCAASGGHGLAVAAPARRG